MPQSSAASRREWGIPEDKAIKYLTKVGATILGVGLIKMPDDKSFKSKAQKDKAYRAAQHLLDEWDYDFIPLT